MEDSRKVYKFEGEEGEDFQIWIARTEAALEAKDVLSVVIEDHMRDGSAELTPSVKLSIAKAKATLIQGLGDKPLRLVLPHKDNPFNMMKLLKERYAVSNLVTKVQLHTKLSRMQYKGQAMSEYVGDFENLFNQLTGMGSSIDEDMKVATFLASFGDKTRSSFGHLVTVLQSKESSCSWEAVSSALLQEYEEQTWASNTKQYSKRGVDSTLALTATGQKGNNHWRQFRRKDGRAKDRPRCFECGQQGHFARDHRINGKKVFPGAQSSTKQEAEDTGKAHYATMLMALSKAVQEVQLLMDSGASDHMVNRADWLTDMRPISPKVIIIGNGDSVTATHEGTLVLQVKIQGGGPTVTRIVRLQKVLLVPGLAANLLSCSALCRDGYELTFNNKVCVAWDKEFIELQGVRCGGVYIVRGTVARNEQGMAMTANHRKLDLWHDRLGHAHTPRIKELSRKGAVVGLDLDGVVKSKDDCSACQEGKQAKMSMSKKALRSTRKGEVIHSDVSGRMSVKSLGGSEYYVTFIDEYSGYITVFPIAKKSDVLEKLKLFHAWFERKYDCKFKKLHCDGGGEYVGCNDYLTAHGIEMPPNPPYCPEVNGMAERANRTLMDSARAMLQHSGLPKQFWAEAVTAAADIRNRFLCPRSDSRTSYEMLTGNKPRVDHIRVFGSLAWVHVPKKKRRKLDAKSREGLIIGSMENNLYKVWMKGSKTPEMSRHLRIEENKFPDKNWFSSSIEGVELSDTAEYELEQADALQTLSTSTVSNRPLSRRGTATDQSTQELLTYVPAEPSRFGTDDGTVSEAEEGQNESDGHGSDAVQEQEENGRYPTRERGVPDYYNPGSAFLSRIGNEPMNISEAMSMDDAENWRTAIEEEMQSLKHHDTWEVTAAPKDSKVLSSRFVFRRKMNHDGSVARHKARLVVKGFMQGPVDHTYAPVVDFTTIRAALAIAVQKNYHIHQMDVRTAFLHGVIDDDVYISPPAGAGIDLKRDQVLKLKKGLYGLKQAPRLWYEKWKEVMIKLGLTALVSDRCVFRRGKLWVLLYVDDVIIIVEALNEVQDLKKELAGQLDMKDLGILTTFLGVLFSVDAEGACLSQAHYVDEILSRFGMQDCKSIATPAVIEGKDEELGPAVDQRGFQELVGSLLFLSTRTRPDIAVAVNLLTRHCAQPMSAHMRAAKRVLRYLKGTRDAVLYLGKGDLGIVAYSDANWAGDKSDRKSTSGMLIQLGGTTVFWASTKQKSVALSSTEAEFIAASETCKIVVWMHALMKDFDVVIKLPTAMKIDNQGAISWGVHGVRHAKHVEMRRNFVLDLVQEGKIQLEYCPTDSMPADIFTKPLLRLKFEANRLMIGLDMGGSSITSKRGT